MERSAFERNDFLFRLSIAESKMVRVVADQRKVLLGVLSGLILCAVPFASDGFRKREQKVAEMRDASYDAKDGARDGRLKSGVGPLGKDR